MPLRSKIAFFLSRADGLVGVLRFLIRASSRFSGKEQNSCFHQLQQVALKQQSSPTPSHCHLHLWLLVWSLYEMQLVLRCNGTQTYKKFNFCLVLPQNNFPKVSWIIQDVFWYMWAVVCSIFPSLFLIIESWTLTLSKPTEACSSIDVVLGF